jgi:hypothetical protein
VWLFEHPDQKGAKLSKVFTYPGGYAPNVERFNDVISSFVVFTTEKARVRLTLYVDANLRGRSRAFEGSTTAWLN